jgi:WD40 repeat protein
METIRMPETRIQCLAFSADDAWLATGGANGKIAFWEKKKSPAKLSLTLTIHQDAVVGLRFDKDKLPRLTSVDERGEMAVTEISGQRLTSFASQKSTNHCGISADGRIVATANKDGTLFVIRVQNGDK